MDSLFFVGSSEPLTDLSQKRSELDGVDTERLVLKSFPHQSVQLPSQCKIVSASSQNYHPLDRSQLIDQVRLSLDQFWKKVSPAPVSATPIIPATTIPAPTIPALTIPALTIPAPRVLLLLPDKTRTSVAPRLLIDAMLSWKVEHPTLGLTV